MPSGFLRAKALQSKDLQVMESVEKPPFFVLALGRDFPQHMTDHFEMRKVSLCGSIFMDFEMCKATLCLDRSA